MKCADVKHRLPELAGGELGPTERAACEAHLPGCPSCAAELSQLREAIGRLRRAGGQIVPPPDFARSLHLRLAKEGPPPRSLTTRLWEALGALGLDSGARLGALFGAAAVGAVLLWTTVPGRGPTGAAPTLAEAKAPFQVPSRRVAVVHFDFVTDAVIDDVQFEVTLPQGLAFISEGKPVADRTLQWSGSLSSGSNPIPLAVSGNRPGRYRIVARAKGEGIDVTHDVLLEVVSS